MSELCRMWLAMFGLLVVVGIAMLLGFCIGAGLAAVLPMPVGLALIVPLEAALIACVVCAEVVILGWGEKTA